MKPDETRDLVEFAVKLQNDVLCPIDSHWPIEKYKAVDEAFQNKDKKIRFSFLIFIFIIIC